MRPRVFTACWLMSAAILSSWALSSASDRAPSPRRQAPDAARPAPPPLSAGLELEISRLTARSRTLANARRPSRNPFEFAAPAAAAPAAGTNDNVTLATVAVALAPEPAKEPVPALSGLAHTADVVTAVIAFRDTLHYVKLGEVIEGRYRVEAVSATGVDLFDLRAGTILRLSFETVT